jgi:2'-5' RNA ligase
MQYQLRIYDVAPGKMDEFLAIFPQVVAARRAVGFEVVGAWTVPDENRFVWIIGAAESIDELAERYYRSPQRAAIEPEPASFLDRIETHLMEAVSFT